MNATVYIAINEAEAYESRVLYAGTDQQEAIESIRDAILDDISDLVSVDVNDDGSVELNFTGDFRVMEVEA